MAHCAGLPAIADPRSSPKAVIVLSQRSLTLVLLTVAVCLVACSGQRDVRMGPTSATPTGVQAVVGPAVAAAAAVSTPAARSVTVAAVGDLMFARDVTTLMEERGALYPFERVRALWADADIVLGNLEGTYTERGMAMSKEYTFRTPPSLAKALSVGGLHAVVLANNHMYDFGAPGLDDTLTALRGVGIAHAGAGITDAAALAPTILAARGGTRVAILAFDDIGEVQFATATQPGVARADPEMVGRSVTGALAKADFVLVYFHWGAEYSREPTARQRALAQAAVSAGASAVIGAHPHVLQQWERIDGVPVLFSMGNFVFDLKPADVDWLGVAPFQSAVAMITLSRNVPARVSFVPVTIDATENRPRPATDAEAAAILGWLEPPASQAQR
ncbi:MAG: CapA family protein [Dehalococcoidia bacterium]|nr:MAG: CapA family protein [Dehalococcoidia bacterium]